MMHEPEANRTPFTRIIKGNSAMVALAMGLVLLTNPARSQSRQLDDFVSADRWEASPSDGVEMQISTDAGKDGRALRVDFDFGGGGGYAIARLPVTVDLPQNYEFSFLLRGDTPVNTLELKLLDESRENVWWSVRRRYRFPTDWTRVRYKKRHIGFAWGPKGGGEIEHVSALEIVVTAAEGGKGTIWVDDLTFSPLEPERPYDLTPSLTASSVLATQAAIHALDGRKETAWRSVGHTGERLEIDFLRRRELGGLVIDWVDDASASDYDIWLSVDGKSWDPGWKTRGGDGDRDWIALPESEARYIRVDLLRGPGAGFGIREIEVIEPADAETKSALWARIARESPRGSFPKYLSGEQSYWTIVGAPGDRGEALINEEGTIDIDPIRFSLDPFLRTSGPDGERLLSWADAGTISQSLENGDLPIPSVTRHYREIDLGITAFARGEAGHSVLWTRYRVTNRARAEQDVILHLAIRPLQVNPSWQFLAMPGGSAEITSIARKGDRILVNDSMAIIPLTRPDSFGAMSFDQGEIVERLRVGKTPTAQSVEDPRGSGSGVMSWSLSIPAGESRDVVVTVPFHERPASLSGVRSSDEAAERAERELAVARTDWSNRLGRVGIHLPEQARHITRAIRSNLAYILINMDGASIQPGSRSYDRSWIRDGSLTSAALLRLGHSEEVERFIDWYARYQRPNGYVPCCVGTRGGDPVPENDSHGQFIYLVHEYYDFTGDRAFLERMWPHVRMAAEYIDELRHQRMTEEYRSGDKRAFYGLMPESISHEGYSAKPMHSYWDDFFALKGLEDAADIAAILGTEDAAKLATIRDDFRVDLYASIERTMEMHGIDYIPGSVELGDFDATSTTVAINPGGGLGSLPEPALTNTFDRYWREFVARRDGSKEWEGYTPYEWRVVGSFIRMGQAERAREAIDWFFSHSRPSAWNHWAEVVYRDPSTPKFIGDMPHTWVGSDFIRSILDMFAWERRDALVIGSAIPLEWVETGEGISVEMLRTRFGPLSWSMKRDGDFLVAEIDSGLHIPDGGIVIVSPIDQSETVVRELPARVRLGTPSGERHH